MTVEDFVEFYKPGIQTRIQKALREHNGLNIEIVVVVIMERLDAIKGEYFSIIRFLIV